MVHKTCLQLVLAVFSVAVAKIEMEFTKWPESVTAPVGDMVTFECEVRVPGERLAWRWKPIADDAPWKEVTEPYRSDEVATRLVIEVRRNMKDRYYQCVVWYGAAVLASVPARLTIVRMDLSLNTEEKRVITAPLKSNVALHCKPPFSEPPAVLSWFREVNGNKTPMKTNHGVLLIDNATEEDSGTYSCSATNDLLGQTMELPEKTVLRIQHEGRTSARFLETEDYVGSVDKSGALTVSVYPNDALFLVCGAVGISEPVHWNRENGPMPSRAKITNNGHHLTIAPLKPEDAGTYSCSARGLRRSWRARSLSAAAWGGVARSLNATEGRSARVTCGAPRGHPAPPVHWLLNAEPAADDRMLTVTDSELYIERVEKRHAGIVQCVACNTLGCAYDAALLQVFPVQISDQEYSVEKTSHHYARLPKRHGKTSRKHPNKAILVPPSRPNVTRMSNESVMVSWSNGTDGLPILFFKVQYKEAMNMSNSQWNTCNLDIPPHIHSYQINGLTPDRYYKFRISAVYSNQDNKQGRSTGRFYLQKGEFRGPKAPVLTNATALSPTSIVLNWTYSSGDSVPAEGFYVYYRAVFLAGEYTKVTVDGGAAATGAALSHLTPDTKYDVKVQAYTAQAPSEFSAILSAKTMRSLDALTTTTTTPGPEERGEGARGALVTAGGAAAAALAALLAATLLRRRCARHTDTDKEKASPEGGGTNGYIPAKVPITITANPMHGEGGESGVEMSYMHNNNTGSDDSTLPHPRKNGPNPRYV